MSRPQIKIQTSVEREYRVTRTSLELLRLSGMNIGNNPLDSLLAGLNDKEVAIDDNDEDEDDDDDEDLDSKVFEQGRSGSSDRSTEFELNSHERLRNT